MPRLSLLSATMRRRRSRPRDENSAPIRFAEFVALIAALMAVGALGIDTMLPALPAARRAT